jgi:hypothetical protein
MLSSRLKSETQEHVLSWLLEPEQPAVRYHALVGLMGRAKNAKDVLEARAQIPLSGWAAKILEGQDPEGRWAWKARESLYVPKYLSTIWNLIVLADLGMTAQDERVRRSCKLFLNGYSRPDGGFDNPSSDWRRSELCLTGNLARTLVLCGYEDDPRVRSAFDWLVENQMKDGGWHCFYEQAFGRGTLDCWEGLSAYAVLPRSKWTRRIKQSSERGAEFYLQRALYRQGKRYVPWFRFHYPVHYYYDVLVGLDVMTKLGYGGDRRLGPALKIMRDKRRKDGTWALDAVHPDLGVGAGYRVSKKRVTPFALETKGQPSKWITLTCLQVLDRVQEALEATA